MSKSGWYLRINISNKFLRDAGGVDSGTTLFWTSALRKWVSSIITNFQASWEYLDNSAIWTPGYCAEWLAFPNYVYHVETWSWLASAQKYASLKIIKLFLTFKLCKTANFILSLYTKLSHSQTKIQTLYYCL